MKLTVSEAFFSLQGEGATSGNPALFIRFSKCNLKCIWCDSQGVMSKTKEIDLLDLIQSKYFNRVIFTGGEPMLYQQEIKEAFTFIKKTFPQRFFFFEIETNGTILPDFWFMQQGFQFNISPKLENSAMPEKARKAAENVLEIMDHSNSFVKFVIAQESDFAEIQRDFIDVLRKFHNRIYLMPAGASKVELDQTAPMVAALCIQTGLKFSNRQHIILWDTKKGV